MSWLLYFWKANNEQILADNPVKLGFEIMWLVKEMVGKLREKDV